MKKNIDRVTLFVSSGKGGDGSASLRREAFVRKGGPDGGDGGDGGSIIFEVDRNLMTLNHLRYTHHFRAENGDNGSQVKRHGKNGADIIIQVPPGTVIIDKEGNEIKDLIDGKYVLLKGGKGGKGNVHFKSSTNRTPRKFTKGQPGESEEIILEMRIIADVGLVGKPNAGKSTLLKTLTKAKPKIADYPFTTLEPNLGILNDGFQAIRIADIPGLIEGASAGKGLGIRFLKHISRVKLLLFVIDINEKDPEEVYELLKGELAGFDRKLMRRKRIILFNKTDKVDKKKIAEIKKMEFDCEYTFSSLIKGETGNIESLIMKNL